MANQKVVVKHKGKKVAIDVSRCSLIGKGVGLMFSGRENANVLLFEFKNPNRVGIHSYFVFFDFLAVWVDVDDNVVQVDRVKPWVSYLRPKKAYVRLIEIPVNKKNEELVGKFC